VSVEIGPNIVSLLIPVSTGILGKSNKTGDDEETLKTILNPMRTAITPAARSNPSFMILRLECFENK
jgi:hypothetical protein